MAARNDLHHQKANKKLIYKTFKQFFYPSNSFSVIAALNVEIRQYLNSA